MEIEFAGTIDDEVADDLRRLYLRRPFLYPALYLAFSLIAADWRQALQVIQRNVG